MRVVVSERVLYIVSEAWQEIRRSWLARFANPVCLIDAMISNTAQVACINYLLWWPSFY